MKRLNDNELNGMYESARDPKYSPAGKIINLNFITIELLNRIIDDQKKNK